MPAPPIELELPPELDEAAVAALLAAHLDVEPGRARTEELVLLDSFDGRLRGAGLRAQHPASRAATVALTVRADGEPPATAEVPRARRLLVCELPPGPVRDRLAPVLEERALLPLARVRRRTVPLAVRDGDGKTVVRLEVERTRVALGRGAGADLNPRLRVRPVLGYDRALRRTLALLTGELGLREAAESGFDAALRASGQEPGGVPTKVSVELQRDAPADRAAGRVLARLAEVAEANVAGTLDDLDTEFLHDLRVSVRRARSVLRELRGVHPPGPRARLREELRWIQQATGQLRDLDVQLLEWDELVGDLPAERGIDLEPLRELLDRRRGAELRRVRRALRSARFEHALAAWRDVAALPPSPADDAERPRAALPVHDVAADRIRRVHRRMVRDGRAIGEDSPDEALHDLRKRGKELRYLLELFGGLFPAEVVKPMVAALKDLQNVLGRFQDRHVQAETLRGLGDELAGARGGPAALMALGLVVEALAADQAAARGAFRQRFAAFSSKEQRALVRTTFPRLRSP